MISENFIAQTAKELFPFFLAQQIYRTSAATEDAAKLAVGAAKMLLAILNEEGEGP